jgi:hypothetical protein
MKEPNHPPLYKVGMTVEVTERRPINTCEFDEGIEGEIEGWARATIQGDQRREHNPEPLLAVPDHLRG